MNNQATWAMDLTDSEMQEWMEAELAGTNRHEVPWQLDSRLTPEDRCCAQEL